MLKSLLQLNDGKAVGQERHCPTGEGVDPGTCERTVCIYKREHSGIKHWAAVRGWSPPSAIRQFNTHTIVAIWAPALRGVNGQEPSGSHLRPTLVGFSIKPMLTLIKTVLTIGFNTHILSPSFWNLWTWEWWALLYYGHLHLPTTLISVGYKLGWGS